MSSSRLKAATKYIVEQATKRKETTKQQKDSQARSDAEKFKGQMLVINKEHQSALIYKNFGIRLSLTERRELFKLLDAFLSQKEGRLRYGTPEERAATIKLKPLFKTKPGDHVYVVSNFEGAKTAKYKSKNKDDISSIQARYVNRLGRSKEEVTAAGISAMSDLGHGDRGISASQFGVDRAISEAHAKFDLSDAEVTELESIVNFHRAKHKLKINFSHSQIFTKGGIFKKDFRFVISSQDGLQNSADRLKEVAAFTESLESIDILGQETSTLTKDAIGQVILENLAGKTRSNKKVTGKRKAVIKESAKGSMDHTEKTTKAIAYGASRGVSTKGIKRPKQNKGVSSSPLALMSMLNQELPKTVEKNMNSPALVNRTGRFADSVNVVNVIQTPRGFPSVGYSYDKFPYQTFELGYAQGSMERDPRKLIDRSIREIAAKLAIGRFYTRRI